jgi:hypothetical protein
MIAQLNTIPLMIWREGVSGEVAGVAAVWAWTTVLTFVRSSIIPSTSGNNSCLGAGSHSSGIARKDAVNPVRLGISLELLLERLARANLQ